MQLGRKRTYFIKAVTLVTFMSVLIKLFTSIISLPDDASTLLVLRFIPSFSNFSVTNDLSGTIVLMLDENELLGQSLYELITHYIWWISLIILMLNYFFQRMKINRNINKID